MQRHATKKFDGRTIPEAKINELIDLIRYAPSGLNLQPWKIKIVVDQKLKEELLVATFNQQQIVTCSHLLVFCANTKVGELIQKVGGEMKAAGVPGKMLAMFFGIAENLILNLPTDAKVEWVKCQVYLALGNAVNGSKSLGFDSCPMSGFNPSEYSRILKIPEHLVPTILCPVGYAADKPMPKLRFPKEDILF
jgi:nitroreductase